MFKWAHVRKTLEQSLTREKWQAWRDREATSYSAGGATGGVSGVSMLSGVSGVSGVRKQIVVAKWENTVGAILLHYQRVMHEAICTLSTKCRVVPHEVPHNAGDAAPALPQTQKNPKGANAVRQKGPQKRVRKTPTHKGPKRPKRPKGAQNF